MKEKKKKPSPNLGNKYALGNDGGRPKADIDWEYVDSLLVAGCSGASIANTIGVNKATIYDRCLKDNGIPFSEYSQQKNEKGHSLLRKRQYEKAMGITDEGDNTLLIFLGKVRLKQRENDDENQKDEISKTDFENLRMENLALKDQLKEMDVRNQSEAEPKLSSIDS